MNMTNPALLAFVAAIFGGAMAFAVAMQAKRSVSHWSFAIGMFALAAESIFASLGLNATSAETLVQWETCKLVAESFLPGLWLCFSLSYARGNSREFLKRWQVLLAGAFLVPVGLAAGFGSGLLTPQPLGSEE